MATTFDQGKDDIAKLCRYFATNRAEFRKPAVKEAHVRQMLIDPFFESLGWDVCNKEQVAPQYREVITEDSLEVEGHQRAPDYDFRVTAFPKFYGEAKKCVVDIRNDPQPAFQLRRYGFSAKIALSALTNFEAFAAYDCTIRPYPSNKASHARLQICGFEEYPDRWRELWDVFSREAVRSGAFDNFAVSKRKRGTSEVDDEFLKEIEGWRDILARNFALRNDWLSADDLNAAVQMTIDRVVFLRMSEDKSLEPYGQLLKLCERPDIYARFMRELCRRADEKYNSGLFHFRKEADVSDAPDQIAPKLSLDDKVFKPILEGLYMEHGCPYHFGILPVEILGTVYERFLGKVIRLTTGHQAKVEEKPEVRKAGGVYYTPKHIVDYIVKQTVGEQIEGKSPAELAGAKGHRPFRVLDMACGSGSFLLGAYQCLLDHYLRWYSERDPAASKKAAFQYNGQLRLTIAEKKRILTTHIFGIDIDRQAVEVTKLSLLLKALEGENDASFSQQLEFFPARVLPNLSENIKWGNSLIGPEYFTGEFLPDAEGVRRVNPFDWRRGFPGAMNDGGFDCVIGNPPYGIPFSDADLDHLAHRFPDAAKFPDSYCFFMLRAFDLIRDSGFLSYVVPNTFCDLETCDDFRLRLLNGFSFEKIWQSGWAFKDAVVDTLVFRILKKRPKSGGRISVLVGQREYARSVDGFINNELHKIDYRNTEGARQLALRLSKRTANLGSFATVKAGVKMYEKGKGTPPQTAKTMKERPFSTTGTCPRSYKPLYRGQHIARYRIARADEFVNYGPWLAAPRDPELFASPKILMRRTDDRLLSCLENEAAICVNSCHVIKLKDDALSRMSYLCLLGFLNSRLLQKVFEIQNPQMVGKVFAEIKVIYVERLPIRALDLSDASDKAHHGRMASLVSSMLALNEQLAAAKSAGHKETLERQIVATDAAIDRLVYDLYGLTDEEIAIVEGPGA